MMDRPEEPIRRELLRMRCCVCEAACRVPITYDCGSWSYDDDIQDRCPHCGEQLVEVD